MKSIKKILAAVMATAVVGAACMVPVSAYDTTANFKVEEKTVTMEEAAGNIVVSFDLTNDTVINSTAFQFTFDDKLELVKIVAGSGITAATEDGAINGSAGNKETAQFALACTPGDTMDGVSGQVVKLTFKINDPDMAPGSKYAISAVNYNDVIQEITAGDTVNLTPSFSDGYIAIAGETTETTETTVITTTSETTTTTSATTTTTSATTTTTEATTTTTEATTTTAELTVSNTETSAASGTEVSGTTTAKETTKGGNSTTKGGNTSKTESSPTTGDTSSAAGMLAVLALAGAAAVATKKARK